MDDSKGMRGIEEAFKPAIFAASRSKCAPALFAVNLKNVGEMFCKPPIILNQRAGHPQASLESFAELSRQVFNAIGGAVLATSFKRMPATASPVRCFEEYPATGDPLFHAHSNLAANADSSSSYTEANVLFKALERSCC